MNTRLDELENDAIFVLREARALYQRPAMLWSMGKDSTTLLWLARKAFFGTVPFPVLHIDTSYKFPEMYAFRDRLAAEWDLDLVVHRNEEALAAGMGPECGSKLQCCTALKTDALRQATERNRFDALVVGIREDEHGVRAKERVFSPRDAAFAWKPGEQPPEMWELYTRLPSASHHVRVHPLLRWREIDIWQYIEREGIPCVDLYFARDRQRFRSLGCRTCCAATPSDASDLGAIVAELRETTIGERAGRAQDKEAAATMEKLRALGYM